MSDQWAGISRKPLRLRRELTLSGDGQAYRLSLEPNRRSRHIRLRVVPAAGAELPAAPESQPRSCSAGRRFLVKITHPPRIAPTELVRVFWKNHAWIQQEIQRQSAEPAGFDQKQWQDGDACLFRGQPLRLRLLPGKGRTFSVQGSELVGCTRDLPLDGIRKAMETWYRRQARRLVEESVRHWSQRMAVRPARITIRGQKTRWGSCSLRGSLSFNWKLAMVPEFVLDYLVVHELAHLLEFNHSQRFWELVKGQGVAVKHAKAWLKQHRAGLR